VIIRCADASFTDLNSTNTTVLDGPDLGPLRYLSRRTLFASWLWNTTFIALRRPYLARCAAVAGICSVAELSISAAWYRHLHYLLVPQTLLFIPCQIIRNYRLVTRPVTDLTYPPFYSVLHWLMMGYFKAVPRA